MAFHHVNYQIIAHIVSYFNDSSNRGKTTIVIIASGHTIAANWQTEYCGTLKMCCLQPSCYDLQMKTHTFVVFWLFMTIYSSSLKVKILHYFTQLGTEYESITYICAINPVIIVLTDEATNCHFLPMNIKICDMWQYGKVGK